MVPDGFFDLPYGPEELETLAESSDPMERWEAASLLAQYDSETRSRILRILRGETDPLVLSAMPIRPDSLIQDLRVKPLGLGEKQRGFFSTAFQSPIGPSMRRELTGWAQRWAWESFGGGQSNSSGQSSFPQANSVHKMMEMLDQIIDRQAVDGTSIGLNDRQVLYYISALEFVSLIRSDQGSGPTARPEVLEQDTMAKRVRLVIEKLLGVSAVGAAYLMRLQVADKPNFPPVPKNHPDLVQFFKESPESSSLSGATLHRRVGTAVSWARQVADILGAVPPGNPTKSIGSGKRPDSRRKPDNISTGSVAAPFEGEGEATIPPNRSASFQTDTFPPDSSEQKAIESSDASADLLRAHVNDQQGFLIYSMGPWRRWGEQRPTQLGSLISTIKYGQISPAKRTHLLNSLLDAMTTELRRIWRTYPAEYCIPVPSNRKAGFDLPLAMSMQIGKRTALRNRPELLRKRRQIPPMKKVARNERPQALDGAYVATRPLMSERGVLIVDDVCDTGSTLKAVNDAFGRVGLEGSLQFLVLAHLDQPGADWEPLR